ncbi:MAG: 4-(cytidine 5'-diphospho)-2-C-methyl-D-erythritol kinase [Bacteroidales bacterium]|nr:4-(cytidine 5'-diphospho)-2-C-methyl-D-erythritol kinase [Bacteroidales bacterium]MDD3200577.1 4-(cytidine 5'-diphospho)-2-C-methyl-D-erythritol kinase [Bacteroidales bacterium]
MIFFPNAKINLGLNIIERRVDGFHNIETLYYPCYQMTEMLEVVAQPETAMYIYGLKVDGNLMDNLCMKAYRLLARHYDLPPAGIHLYKKIPIGAGLGGGSADAAFTLMALNRLFSLDISDDDLAGYAAVLGSDCPLFIYNKPMIARGRGEILTPYRDILDGYKIEIVHPEIFISTKEAYLGVTPHKAEVPLEEALKYPVEQWREVLFNDFEESIFKKYPVLAKEKEFLYNRGAVYASLSGSGSALFGLFGS